MSWQSLKLLSQRERETGEDAAQERAEREERRGQWPATGARHGPQSGLGQEPHAEPARGPQPEPGHSQVKAQQV